MRRLAWATLFGTLIGGAAALGLAATAADSAEAGPPKEGFPPDPPPKANKKHWVFEVQVRGGAVSLGKVTEVELPKETATARVMGRYALELYVGNELLDRVRFNVPLGGDGPAPPDRPGLKRPEFKVTTKLYVRMADHPRAARLRLVDRATGDVRTFLWPVGAGGLVEVGASDAPGDGGTSDAAPPQDAAPDADAGPPKDAADAAPPDAYAPLEP